MTDEFFVEDPDLEGLIRFDQLKFPRVVIRKSRFEEVAASLTEELVEENSPLEAYVLLKNVAEIIDISLTTLREPAIGRVEGTSQQVLGVTVQIKSLPKRWQYDDTEIQRLEGEKDAIDLRIRERKKFLEHLKQEMVNPATGEIIQPAKCISEGCTIQVLF